MRGPIPPAPDPDVDNMGRPEGTYLYLNSSNRPQTFESKLGEWRPMFEARIDIRRPQALLSGDGAAHARALVRVFSHCHPAVSMPAKAWDDLEESIAKIFADFEHLVKNPDRGAP